MKSRRSSVPSVASMIKPEGEMGFPFSTPSTGAKKLPQVDKSTPPVSATRRATPNDIAAFTGFRREKADPPDDVLMHSDDAEVIDIRDLAVNTRPVMTPVTTPKKENKMADGLKKTLTFISQNQDTLKRKLIVGLGTGVGMIIASSVIDRLNNSQPEVVYIEVPVTSDDISRVTDTPTE